MRRFDERASERIQAAVEAIERDSAAEVVVKIVPVAGGYPDVAWRVAALFVLAAALIMALAAAPSHADVAPGWLGAAGMLGYVLGARWWRLIGWMTSEGRQRRAVEDASRLAFHDEALGGTRAGTGVLVYGAVFEDRIVVVADHRLRGLAAGAAWGRLDLVGGPGKPLEARLDDVLKELAALVRAIAPRLEDDTNELFDAPRVGGGEAG